MRCAFAHTAEFELSPDGDPTGPEVAVVAEVRPVARLHTAVGRVGDRTRLRVLFACDVDIEDEVRARIDAALARGTLAGPDGPVARWSLRDAMPGAVQECERAEAERLLAI